MSTGSWLPPAISGHAIAYDTQLYRTLTVAVIIFFAAQFAVLLFAYAFRSRKNGPGAARMAERSGRMEAFWTISTAVLFLGLLALGARDWSEVQFSAEPAGAETIEVLAKQFAWNFRYAGPDGRFGRTDPALMNDAAGNPFGLDPADARGRDDIVSATLRVPASKPVKLMLNSVDVIHSFFVRELRLKQDTVPGMRIPLSFTATVPGTYEIPCAELCGLGHFQMRATMMVLPPSEYENWKKAQKP